MRHSIAPTAPHRLKCVMTGLLLFPRYAEICRSQVDSLSECHDNRIKGGGGYMSCGGQLAELEKDLSTARSGRTIRPFRASGRLGEGFWQPPSVYDPSLSSSFALPLDPQWGVFRVDAVQRSEGECRAMAGANACINYFQNGLNGKLGDGDSCVSVGHVVVLIRVDASSLSLFCEDTGVKNWNDPKILLRQA
ncbi:hypothetical protein DB88DRAFT_518003 [Papiliotrema laurentii]|uniref:Uncharacterized protein n=1 Tax=Papiliotrema laurentii TaxID=5418 RepID=A0AAD9FQ73_PAPLA|nr:hypothetical protein DB88DRAFT_518003 [Papiliotrema laurentii]